MSASTELWFPTFKTSRSRISADRMGIMRSSRWVDRKLFLETSSPVSSPMQKSRDDDFRPPCPARMAGGAELLSSIRDAWEDVPDLHYPIV